MSVRPISAADERELAAALAAGWSESDLGWEIQLERAADFALQGDFAQASILWNRCLEIARKNFPPDDPRMGTSLANVGFALRQNDRETDAAAIFNEARRIWAVSPAWIDRMRPENPARSSVHHFRMEIKNRRIYQANARRRLHDFAADARRTLKQLADGGSGDAIVADNLVRWRAEKPPIFGDSRKLLAACLLLAKSIRP